MPSEGGMPTANTRSRRKWIGLAMVVTGGLLLYGLYGQYLRLDYLAQQEARLQALQEKSPILVTGAAFLIYVLVTGLSLPGAALLTRESQPVGVPGVCCTLLFGHQREPTR